MSAWYGATLETGMVAITTRKAHILVDGVSDGTFSGTVLVEASYTLPVGFWMCERVDRVIGTRKPTAAELELVR